MQAVLLLMSLAIAGCAYYNTLFNARNSYEAGLKALRESPDQNSLPAPAKKSFETTIEKCWKLIDIYSDKSKYADDALLYIAKSEFYIQKYAQAQQHLEQFLSKYPKSDLIPEATLWLGKVLLKEKEIERANEFFLQVITTTKNGKLRSQANFELGLYAFENNNYTEAISRLQQALKEDITDEKKAMLLFYLGDAYYIQKDYKNAIAQFKKVEKFEPSIDIEYKTLLHRALSHGAQNAFPAAEEILRKMLTAPRFKDYVPSIKTTMAGIYEKENRMADAIDMYREVVKERKPKPGTAEAAFNLGRIYEHVYNDIDSAVAYYGKVSQLYGRYDSVKVAQEKQRFLGELKTIQDQIENDSRLVKRLTSEPAFRDSLYRAQARDSLMKVSGIQPDAEKPLPLPDSLFTQNADPDSLRKKALLDSLKKAQADSLKNKADSLDLTFPSFRNPREEEKSEDKKKEDEPLKPGEKAASQKPIEKRKLPQIEFDLMNSRFHLAEFYLLKEQAFDSAAYHYEQFLSTYEDSILSPKALYSLAFILRTAHPERQGRIDSLENRIIQNYPGSQFARQIRIKRGEIRETPEITPEQTLQREFVKAESLYFAGNYQAAISAYQSVADRDSTTETSAKAQFAIGWIYEHDLQNVPAALEAYRRLSERFPKIQKYAQVARRKISPPREEKPPANDTLLAATTPDISDTSTVLESQKKAIEEDEASAATHLDILEEKIRWRRRRDMQGPVQ